MDIIYQPWTVLSAKKCQNLTTSIFQNVCARKWLTKEAKDIDNILHEKCKKLSNYCDAIANGKNILCH